ncbi:helix-turn-helix domain-containing protein [Paenibacillus roseipurpureus]|uniref:Helix-turn-helix domain-containing protein n=1 Tax=Paenibacillus roseopurpureus TaxID=2918901 RepID=A0AA96LLE5_9BACL|nr:helix-turn-helix domain-containing protein [Paenibacillus sp. MBLB1832]WNR44042.1 helix-turn-helix domain-containing protein [Paenibacillus sp. MBLB1832]
MNIDFKRYYFSKQRNQFTLPEDTYQGWCLLAANSGRFTFSLGGDSQEERMASFGELVFCPPGVLLKRQAVEPISFHFAEFTVNDGTSFPELIRIKDIGRLSSTLRYLQEWQEEDLDIRKNEDAAHLLEDLLFMTNREQHINPKHGAGSLDPLMNQAAANIEVQAFGDNLSLQYIADLLGISSSQLTRRFQAAYGLSPIRYATKIRLTKARSLLAETSDTLEDIAEQCGFQNAFYFSRVFSQHMQISPSAYRRTFRV